MASTLTTALKLAFCSVFTVFLGDNPVIYSPAPRGDCSTCCPMVEKSDIRFLLYTRSNPKSAAWLTLGDRDRLEASPFNLSLPTVVYLHGFSEKAPGVSGAEIRDAYLERGFYNIILVDWGSLTALPWYVSAVANAGRAGRYVALFLRFLLNTGVRATDLHVIGFSLGAAAAGVAGKALREWGTPIRRITGLDPAFPLYMFGRQDTRLGADDAIFVDVIHTDGGVLGFPWPLGHADFFPNGGVPLQPGCAPHELLDRKLIGRIVGCSHQRAWRFYAESVRSPDSFPAKCPSCPSDLKVFMGEPADPRLRGKFYLSTNAETPYGKKLKT